MRLLKNRAFVIPMAIIVILAVGVITAFSDLKSDIRKTEKLYYDGVKAESGSYVRPSIYNQMNFKVTTANSVLGIIDAYPELEEAADALREAKDRVFDCTGAYDEDAIRNMGWANEEFLQAVTKLKAALEDVSLPEREQKELDRCLKDLDGAQSVIEASGYNEAVREFNMGVLQKFPAKQMLRLMKNPSGGATYFGNFRYEM